jgi:prevent-host-death family protein
VKAANVRPITDLKNHAKELVQEVADGGQPLVITQNGRARAVLMDVEQHDRLLDTLAMLKLLAQSQEGLARSGRVYSTGEVRRRAKAAIERAADRT